MNTNRQKMNRESHLKVHLRASQWLQPGSQMGEEPAVTSGTCLRASFLGLAISSCLALPCSSRASDLKEVAKEHSPCFLGVSRGK